ncbi:LolA family protein [Saccharibacillus kuerlensis]|uniref:Outer membrane lipoprotein-sorting protein n=1 Tax=Saccharibacillus kuerlensis TaxID=459527 RepID=A0ABQ2KZP6_9BACL|nr:DUF2092 domain-containing protein [Saccharibacillus kuerlensis]GGN98091.1 hypothetical protein GCM10010969_16720 [Saccharibacillus kuerlensis]
MKKSRFSNEKSKAAALLGGILVAGAVLAGCGETGNALAYTEAEIVERAVSENTAPFSYYAEAEMTLYDGEKMMESMRIKEWYNADSGSIRNEVKSGNNTSISVNDGKQVTVYEQEQNLVYRMDAGGTGREAVSHKDKIVAQFERMRDSHSIETVGKEKWLNKDVYHIKAVPNEEKKNTLVGVQEYWIDAQNWMIVKSSASSGDTRTEFAYTLIDESPAFDQETFEIDIPADAEMVSLDEMGPKQITLEEAETAIGQPFLQLPESTFKQTEVTLFEGTGELARKEISLTYLEEGGTPISLSLFESPEDAGKSELGEKVTVRGVEGYYMEEISSLTWDENGLRYSLMIMPLDREVSLDHLMELANQLEMK